MRGRAVPYVKPNDVRTFGVILLLLSTLHRLVPLIFRKGMRRYETWLVMVMVGTIR